MRGLERFAYFCKEQKRQESIIDTRQKVCKGCGDKKLYSEFSIHTNCYGNIRPDCKKCHSRTNTNNIISKRAKKNPEKYRVCNKCDRSFSININHLRKIPEGECKYCDSKDVEKY